MAVYNFGRTFTNTPRGTTSFTAKVSGGETVNAPIDMYPPAMSHTSHVEDKIAFDWERDRTSASDIHDFIEPGFRYLDEGMKTYFGDLRIPTNDSYRFMKIRVAGFNKSVAIWRDEIQNGRVKLPVMSINRGQHSFNPQKFSPPYLAMSKKFVNNQKTKIEKTFRPVPWNVSYTLDIWAAHKRDAEYGLYQILRRFNPLAEMRISDGRINGNVQMLLEGSSDDSDKDAAADQLAQVKYSINLTAEAWLSLPTQVIPTVMGRVVSIKDRNSNTLGLI